MFQKDTKFEDLPVGAVFITEGEGEYVKVGPQQARNITLGEPFYAPPPTELVREDIVEWDCPEVIR